MCGIAGYFYKNGKTTATTTEVVNMLSLQRHRGPDDAGVRSFSFSTVQSVEHNPYTATNIEPAAGLLGFNRLSIVDLSVNGHQPMSAVEGKVILAFNGEIYNAFDFVPALKAAGYVFRGHSDTEVILNLYLHYGFDKMIVMLNGMFAIVLIDLRIQTVYLARDRFGIKPMYIWETKEWVAFSSELKSFFSLPGFQPELNQNLVSEFVIFRNVVNDTLLKGVKNLEPGTYLKCQPGHQNKIVTFFNLNDRVRQPHTGKLEDSVNQIAKVLSNSVKRQLMSDVKLGCQLSGGIDSSLVTWLASQHEGKNFETVSIILDDPRFNEAPFIDQVSNQLRLHSHRFKLEPSYYVSTLEQATWHFENPINHPNTIGIYLLSQQAKRHVTVLLSGEGADEVFGGYERFATVLHPWYWRNFLSSIKKHKEHGWQRAATLAARSIWASAFLAPEQAAELLPEVDVKQAVISRSQLFESLQGDPFDRLMKYEMKTYLPDLLVRQDKMSMAHAIENRVPFLDNELVDASFTLPVNHLVTGGSGNQTKRVLKALASRKFGASFAMRPKQGFGIPLRKFFANPEFRQYLQDAVAPGIKEFGLFNHKVFTNKLERLESLHSLDLDVLWVAISFEVWRQRFLQVKLHDQAVSNS